MKRLKFDKFGHCEKCGCSIQRMAKTKTWHHVEYSDYLRCGFVKIKDIEVAKEEISCLLSIDGKCTGNYAPFKCDGIDRPKECQVLEEDKLK